MDKKVIEEHRTRVAKSVTEAVELGQKPSPEQLHGTVRGLLAVAAVISLKIRGVSVSRRLVDAAAASAADALRDRIDAELRE